MTKSLNRSTCTYNLCANGTCRQEDNFVDVKKCNSVRHGYTNSLCTSPVFLMFCGVYSQTQTATNQPNLAKLKVLKEKHNFDTTDKRFNSEQNIKFEKK